MFKLKKDYQLSQEILKKHFIVDEEKKIVLINLRYEKASDFIDYSIGEMPSLKAEVYDRINELLISIHPKYRCELNIHIKDKENHSSEDIMEIFNDFSNLKHVEIKRELVRKKISSFFLMTFGLIFLILAILSMSFKWINDLGGTVLYEILDIIAWVFIWESVTIYYFDCFKLNATFKLFKRRIEKISISD